MIKATCPACRRRLQVKDGVLGKSARCPSCKHAFTVTVPEVASVATAAPEPTGREPEERPERGRKHEKKADKRPPWLLLAVGGGAAAVVLLCLVGAGVAWMLLQPGGERRAAIVVKAEDVVDPLLAAPGLTREPRPGPASWVPPVPLPSAPPESWKVTADPRPGADALL